MLDILVINAKLTIMDACGLRRTALRYATARGVSLSTVGLYAVGSGTVFSRLADGRVTLRTVAAITAWLSDHWPDHLEWPPDVPRPEPSPASEAKEAA